MTVLRIIFLLLFGWAAYGEESVWQAVREGEAAVLMRHAIAPGSGDPEDFRLGDCSTQRNLSGEGRKQARKIGSLLREKGVRSARVYSSQWCRCVETAERLGLGAVTELPALNSFFRDRSSANEQTAAIQQFLAGLKDGPPVILVTHQVNITALTGVFPASGEMILVKLNGNGDLEVIGRTVP